MFKVENKQSQFMRKLVRNQVILAMVTGLFSGVIGYWFSDFTDAASTALGLIMIMDCRISSWSYSIGKTLLVVLLVSSVFIFTAVVAHIITDISVAYYQYLSHM